MSMITRDQILGINDARIVPVHIPAWSMTVYVRTLTGRERDAFEAEMLADKDKGTAKLTNLRARLASRSLCNVNGERIFRDEDAEALGNKSAAALDLIISATQKLNALTDKEIEDLGEASRGDQNAVSGTASPSP